MPTIKSAGSLQLINDFAPEGDFLNSTSTTTKYVVEYGIRLDKGRIIFTMDDKGSGAVNGKKKIKGKYHLALRPGKEGTVNKGEDRIFMLTLDTFMQWSFKEFQNQENSVFRPKEEFYAGMYAVKWINKSQIEIHATANDPKTTGYESGIEHKFNIYIQMKQEDNQDLEIMIDPIIDNPVPRVEDPPLIFPLGPVMI